MPENQEIPCEQVYAEPSAVICQTNAPDSASGEKR
jgi:hypothetical protein